MNICFLVGKIISEIKFDFVIDEEGFGKKISIVYIIVLLNIRQTLYM